jgi:hypothetical protein
MDERDDVIKFRLVPTRFFTRWRCHVCSGCTDKDAVLCEADSPFSDHGTLRICSQCLQTRNFDHHLEQHAQGLDAEAAAIRLLIGRIEAPSFAEWKQAVADDNAESEHQVGDLPRGDQVDDEHAIPDDLF